MRPPLYPPPIYPPPLPLHCWCSEPGLGGLFRISLRLSRSDFYFSINSVTSVTPRQAVHPGGIKRILLAAGKDVEPYWDIYQQHKSRCGGTPLSTPPSSLLPLTATHSPHTGPDIMGFMAETLHKMRVGNVTPARWLLSSCTPVEHSQQPILPVHSISICYERSTRLSSNWSLPYT